ncbi:hypothetical protein [Halalkaliarchaeum desulfuricum]|uniref:hypothetical protein n=1 Tax=Halalkaliarchaeum desulfuricum TaxID=2055893 RepID=UPI000E6B5FD9|nr:hypothetical protein [Halalkaliarchaeum desulfuricum]
MIDNNTEFDRRTVLGVLAGVGNAALAGCSGFQSEPDAETTQIDEDTARELADSFAPSLYFDEYEEWYPTDPRQYTSERDGDTVVHGFDAVEGYHSDFDSEREPPEPTGFYHVVGYEDSSLVAIQYWFYYVFDQFSCNFHWHDWEVLHVFVDTETGEPQLYVASSHSRDVPNNEFLDPDPDDVPRVLPELGSHSSTLSVNEVADRFQRFGGDDLIPDVTNEAIDGIKDLVDIPLAYGLPRDEGARLPMVIPELDGIPLYEHDAVPSFTRESLIDEKLTIRSLAELESPPTDMPLRETGLVFEHAERDGDGDGDVEYALRPTTEIEHISEFTGPQLSFEFPVPEIVEDAFSHHISTTGTPWDQPRYGNPAADITASTHREALANRYEAIGDPGVTDALIARVTDTTTSEDAPDDEGLTTVEMTQESVALLESEPRMRPTFAGVAMFGDVEPGEHRLTVNSAGSAPHSEHLEVTEDGRNDGGNGDDGDADGHFRRAGVDGEVPVVARDKARRLELSDEEADAEVVRTAIEDDFAGRIYESAVEGHDTVFVHEGGAYTTEVRDRDDEVGAFRVNPDPGSNGEIRIDRPETGKASLAAYLADVAEETRASVAAVEGDADGAENAVRGLERALAAVVEAAEMATERARDGDRGGADQQLEAVRKRLETVADRLADASEDLPPELSNAAENRLEQADRRVDQARTAEKL